MSSNPKQPMSENLNPDKALIFRIVHRSNIPWILDNGMYCRNAEVQAPDYQSIGNNELIEKRQHRKVAISPFGTLSDYIPFYFTPYSPMMYNIKTGFSGVQQVDNEEIVIVVSSLPRLQEKGIDFVFTDRHAYLFNTTFYNTLDKLDQIDWPILQQRDFHRDADNPEKIERYQAEALVYQHLPVEAVIGLVCYTDAIKTQLQQWADERQQSLKIVKETRWYF